MACPEGVGNRVTGLRDLTPPQKEAVTHVDGPLLVLAGPGSGKTRVITRRIAHLVQHGVNPWEVLAITFTNKAANEMAERVQELLPGMRVWVSTFHRFCARVLRQHASALGLQPNYTIFDMSDQRQLLRAVMSDLDISTTHFPPHKVGARISRLKNDLVLPEEYLQRHEEMVGNHYDAIVARVYPAYQQALLRANAVDFDDLLLHVVRLFDECPEIREQLDRRFRYVLVDEYQDTNLVQYMIVRGLCCNEQNLCVTGDPDQSIYGWRGARIKNILQFEEDFADTRLIRLEHNFRSTKEILKAADSLIQHNVKRLHKELFTENEEGAPVELLWFDDERTEADGIAQMMKQAVDSGDRTWSDFAICYRTNALSRAMERALARYSIPYQVASGVAFYDRAEIKDVLSYLRLLHNPNDVAAFQRVINNPLRGIGKTSQNRLIAAAREDNVNLLEICLRAKEIPRMAKRGVGAARKFASILLNLQDKFDGSIENLLQDLLGQTGYLDQWKYSDLEEDHERLANVEELLTAAAQFDRAYEEELEDNGEALDDAGPIQRFLESTSLASEVDSLESASGQVSLMTLHSAKGLEFPVVFVLGVEQNLLPHERALESGELKELEEERRLLFVGMTRAQKMLYLTRTSQREFRGRPLSTITSVFLNEMDLTITRENESTQSPAPDLEWKQLLEKTRKRRDDNDDESFPQPFKQFGLPKMMTGADLLNGTAGGKELPVGFAVGSRVRHPRMGTGTVLKVDGFGARRTVTVEFEDEDATEETFILSKCPLQPIG
ncbi:MAG: UvrD-helicase domain-containing protein [Planctomycetaceae bacterium]|nr:UvrD-helicase domain-containing protein [Planctomycetaceae bacterium]